MVREESDVNRHTVKVVYDNTQVTVQEIVDALRNGGITVQGYDHNESKYQEHKQRIV